MAFLFWNILFEYFWWRSVERYPPLPRKQESQNTISCLFNGLVLTWPFFQYFLIFPSCWCFFLPNHWQSFLIVSSSILTATVPYLAITILNWSVTRGMRELFLRSKLNFIFNLRVINFGLMVGMSHVQCDNCSPLLNFPSPHVYSA